MTFDDDLFHEELRQRLGDLERVKKLTRAEVSRISNQRPSIYKEFMNGKTNKASIVAAMGWARAYEIPFTALIENIGYIYEISPSPDTKVSDADEEREEERFERIKIGHNMRFWRQVFEKSHNDFAAAARIINGKSPDGDFIKACERGEKRLSVIQAKYLVDFYLLNLSDILPRSVT